jgi:hypothetical protein
VRWLEGIGLCVGTRGGKGAGNLGRWKMEDGRWKMEDGRWKMEDGHSLGQGMQRGKM